MKKKKKFYCNIKILLQAIGCRKIFVLQGLRRDYIAMGRICIARLEGYCRLGKAVSRYKNCIVTEVAV